MKKWIVLLVSIALCGSAVAAEDSAQSRKVAAERYARAAQMEKVVDDLLMQIAQQIPAGEREKFRGEMKKILPADAMQRIFVDSAVKTFTADELNALADFYSSPQGASVMSKMGAYMANTMPLVQQEMMKRLEERQQQNSRSK